MLYESVGYVSLSVLLLMREECVVALHLPTGLVPAGPLAEDLATAPSGPVYLPTYLSTYQSTYP